MVLLFAALVFLVLIIKKLIIIITKPSSSSSCSSIALIPTPPSLPIIGHLHYLKPIAFKAFHDVASKYGPFLRLRFLSYPVVLVSSASAANDIFKTNDAVFSARIESPFGETLLFGSSTSFFNAPYGEYWKFMKKVCVTELLGAAQIKRSRHVRREEIVRFLHAMLEKAEKNEAADLSAAILTVANNCTCRMVMSARCSGEDNEAERCRELVSESFDLAAKLALATLFGPFKKLIVYSFFQKQTLDVPRKYNDLFETILKEHEEERARKIAGGEHQEMRKDKDFMDIVLEVYHDKNAHVKITRDQMKTFFLDLFIGGTSTTADGILWVVVELIKNPRVFKKLRDEIESVVGKERLVEESDVPNLPYLQAVVKEAMRMYPPVPLFDRRCLEACKVAGFDIPAGTTMVMNIYSIMRDPQVWDNPNEFQPERFCVSDDQANEAMETKRQPSDFVPFGGGRRGCPGTNLSMGVTHGVIGAMVQCFDLKVEGKINAEKKSGVTMTLANQLVQEANRELYKKLREAEAVLYENTKKAEAQKATADAALYAAKQAAEGKLFSKMKDADAALYAAQQAAEGELISKKKEAEAIGAIAHAQGYYPRTLLESLGGNYSSVRDYILLEKNVFQELASINAQALNGLQPKISIWNNGANNGGEAAEAGNGSGKDIAGLYTMLPPLLKTVQEQTGMMPPAWLATLPVNGDGN